MTEVMEFSSSNIGEASYDDQSKELTISFRSGDEYTYRSVPYEVWHGLMHAPSAGSYFHRQIKNRYPSSKT